MSKPFAVHLALCLFVAAAGGAWAVSPVPDTPFVQEYHEAYPLSAPGANDVRAIAVDADDTPWAATAAGLFVLRDGQWNRQEDVTDGPLYDLVVDADSVLWVGAWNGVYRVANGVGENATGVDGTITAIVEAPQGLTVMGPEGAWRLGSRGWKPLENAWARHIRDAAVTADGELYIGTGVGLYRQRGDAMRHHYSADELYSGDIRAVTVGPDGDVWLAAKGGIDRYSHGAYRAHYGAEEGLPNYNVHSLAFDAEGTLWAGTDLGVARFDGESWSLRHSKRWLTHNHVRGIAFDSEGTAWIATRGGVSAIKRRTMTLEEKAAHFLDICHARHVRAPYLVEKCWLPNPNDFSEWKPLDDDNDGTFTAMYMVMESYRWAVTKDPKAREHANQAFEALEFLETITPIEGFIARTVIPSDWTEMADANHIMTPEEYAERRVRDPRTKRVDERWRLSEDGQWRWKGDTSSDELVGHMFGYYLYYELAADDAYRERVRDQVRKIIDYVIDGGLYLRDLDGEPTRWGVWAPESVLHDPDWRVEGVNKTYEALSFLNAAYHMTGDTKYRRVQNRLIEKYGYADIARTPKSYGRSERTHIQDDLLAFSTPGLIGPERDEDRRAGYLEGATWAYRTIENDQNPFFNFIYGMAGGTDFHLEESVAFLRDHPLDLRHFTIDNSGRDDLTYHREPMPEPLQTSRMLPPSERGVMRWDKNPWAVISGDFGDPNGHKESSGVHWLLPYWMGRYYGWIEAPGQ